MKLSLAKINFLNILFTALIFILAVATFEIYTSYSKFDKQVDRMKERYISLKKNLVKEQVIRFVDDVKNNIKKKLEVLKITLEDKIDEIIYLYHDIKDTHPKLSQEEVLDIFFKTLYDFRQPYSSSYYYIFDNNLKLLYHGDQQNLIGTNAINFKNANLVKVLKEAIQNDEASGQYFWENPKNGKIEKKFVFIKKLPNTHLYIATGFYMNLLEKDIKNEIKKMVFIKRFGKNHKGYFWVHSLDGEMIVHPIQPSLNGSSIYEYKSASGENYFIKMNQIINSKGEGFIKYMWKYPNSNEPEEEKISFVKKIDYVDWVVGSGFYFREQAEAVKQEKQILKRTLTNDFYRLFAILGAISVFAFIGAWLVSKKISKIEKENLSYLHELEQYKQILDVSSIVSKTNADGFITCVNQKFTEITGYSKQELVGKSHNVLRHPSMSKEIFADMWKIISRGIQWNGIIKNRKKDGSSYYVSTTILPIKNEKEEIVEYIAASTDITELVKKDTIIESFALTDNLSGLGSRVKLLEDLNKYKKSAILALIDIKRFTELNDVYGQAKGDEIIKEVARELFSFFDNDGSYHIYRVHADVFAILSISSIKEIFVSKIELLLKYLENISFCKETIDKKLTFVAGISCEGEEHLARADMALKYAKKNNKNLTIYTEQDSLLEEYKNNEKWMRKVENALKEDRIIPYFQPIYSYDTHKIKKYESLLRMKEKDGTIITPNKFLDVIKKTSLYPRITRTMIRKSVDAFRYSSNISFSINLTIEDLLNKETMQYLLSIAKSSSVLNRMIIEIVETEELMNFEQVGDILAELKSYGVKIAIDDFGTGYSNYKYLMKLDVDFIKIDGSIIENIEDKKTKELISTIIKFAKKSDIQTVAEFVSSFEIDKEVQNLGIDFAQGYFRGKPSPKIL